MGLFDQKKKAIKLTKDGYICEDLHITITEVVNDGSVPPFIVCPQCKKMARSLGFHINQSFEAVYEWYKPNDAEILRLTAELPIPEKNRLIENINRGMLVSRPKQNLTPPKDQG